MMTALSQHILSWQHAFESWGLLGMLAYALMMMVLQMGCIPLSPFAIAAGVIFGPVRGMLVVQFGTSLGSVVNFLLTRHFARGRVTTWLSNHEKFRLIDAAVGREGWKIVALLRFCPLPFGLANYCYGLTSVPLLPYAIATFFAIAPGNLMFVWFGATSQEALASMSGQGKAPGQLAFTVIGLVAAFIALAYVTRVARAAVARGEESATR